MDKKEAHQNEDAILMTKAEACTRYSLSLRYLSELIDAQVIPVIRLGRKCVRIPVKAADEKLLSYQIGGAA